MVHNHWGWPFPFFQAADLLHSYQETQEWVSSWDEVEMETVYPISSTQGLIGLNRGLVIGTSPFLF
jgi:hypothetical protein